jgi:fumarate reductase flavoprotein subunit
MVQFHPTGLLAGPDTRMTGTVLEEGLRGSGGWLTDGAGERFMFDYDPRGERATRDIVCRAIMDRLRKGHAGPNGGVFIEMAHLGPENVRREFKGMVERCADCGFDLAGGRVEVIPTAHYMMGGLVFNADCTTELPGLFAAGEDTGGVHGANRLGGNGVANSTVFGGIAGDAMADWVQREGRFHACDDADLAAIRAACLAPLEARPGDVGALREALHEIMWQDVGILRDRTGLARAADALAELDARLHRTGIDASGGLAFNVTWHDWLNLRSLIQVSRAITAAALAREESRGAHFREDFPETRPAEQALAFTKVRLAGSTPAVTFEPVRFTRVRPGESLLAPERARHG